MRYYFTNDTPSPPGLVGSSGYLAKTPSGGGYVELNDKKVDTLVPEVPAQYEAAYSSSVSRTTPVTSDRATRSSCISTSTARTMARH